MKKTATMTINDKVIIINEITVRQMITVKEKLSDMSILDAIKEMLPMLTDAPADFLLDLAPSELESIYEKIKEVNSSFLALFPLESILAGYREKLLETVNSNLMSLSAESLQPDTA